MTGLIVGLVVGILIGMGLGWYGMARGRASAAAAGRGPVVGANGDEPPEQRAARRHLEEELEREPEPGQGEGGPR